MQERTLTAVTQEKYLLFLFFDVFCRLFWIFFFPVSSRSVVVVDFIGTEKSKMNPRQMADTKKKEKKKEKKNPKEST